MRATLILATGAGLVYDGLMRSIWRSRGESLRSVAKEVLGEQADVYLLAFVLGLAETLAGLALVRRSVAGSHKGGPPWDCR